jgi:hypothetical protein
VRNGPRDSFPDWYPFNATRIEIYGSEGFMLLGRHGGGWQAFDAKGRMVKADKITHLESQQAHIGDFLNCVRTRESPKCDIEEGHISSGALSPRQHLVPRRQSPTGVRSEDRDVSRRCGSQPLRETELSPSVGGPGSRLSFRSHLMLCHLNLKQKAEAETASAFCLRLR